MSNPQDSLQQATTESPETPRRSLGEVMADKIPWLLVGQEDLTEMATMADSHARKILLEGEDRDTGFMPHLAVCCRVPPGSDEAFREREGVHLFVLAVDFDEIEEKFLVLDRIAHSLFEQGLYPAAASLTAEAWYAPHEKGVQPRHNPNRKEVLLTQALAFGGAAYAIKRDVTRDAQSNKIVGLGEPDGREAVADRLLGRLMGSWFRCLESSLEVKKKASEQLMAACKKLTERICKGDPGERPGWFHAVGIAIHDDPSMPDKLIVYLKDPAVGIRALKPLCPSMLFCGYPVETRILGDLSGGVLPTADRGAGDATVEAN